MLPNDFALNAARAVRNGRDSSVVITWSKDQPAWPGSKYGVIGRWIVHEMRVVSRWIMSIR